MPISFDIGTLTDIGKLTRMLSHVAVACSPSDSDVHLIA